MGNKMEHDASQDLVQLSLIMIARNEEKNIEKALESVRGIVYESIVADTGSTDKTVDIAGELGAKIYNFEWIDDFSAAKNYAIEQATGNWVLVLDADEYFPQGDAQKLLDFLIEIESDQASSDNCLAVGCMMVNLDDNGRQTTRFRTVRVFRNIPSMRYIGRIHEWMDIDAGKIVHLDNITMMHTGYAESVHEEKGKTERNIAMLRAELSRNPDDVNYKAYLANSLNSSTDPKYREEAAKLFTEILESKQRTQLLGILRVKLYTYFINKYMSDPDKLRESEQMCRQALEELPGTLDFMYYLALVFSKKGEHQKAWQLLRECELRLKDNTQTDVSILIPADPTIIFSQMILTAKELGDIENVLLYSTHVLTIDKTRQSVLGPCIATMLYYGVSESETIELLSNIYDFKNPDDVTIVSTAARSCGATGFAGRVVDLTGESV